MHGENLRKGPWLGEEDEILNAVVSLMGDKRWDSLAKVSGLRRSGKSCRLRWMNYLRPNLKRGRLSEEEERSVIQLHKQWGNKWSRIARRLPGRTDNEIKNYWRSHLRKKAQVQEQGHCKDFSNDIKMENSLVPESSSDSKSGKEEVESIGTTQDDSFDKFGPMNYDIANSPYETRLSDWISSWSEEQSEGSYCGEYNTNLNTGFGYSGWDSEESDISLWGSSVCPSGGHC